MHTYNNIVDYELYTLCIRMTDILLGQQSNTEYFMLNITGFYLDKVVKRFN